MELKRVIVITMEGNVSLVDLPHADSLSTFQKLVGGYIEYIPLRQGHDQRNLAMYVNEDGRFQKKAVNHVATAIARKLLGPTYCELVGNVVLFGYVGTSGDEAIEDDAGSEEYSFLPDDMNICRDVFERHRVEFDLFLTSTI